MTASLCQTFQDLAAETWQRIEFAFSAGLSWSEESNTEHLLLTLRSRHPHQVAIAAFSKRKEAFIGADWEWWFVGVSGGYGMRVQAKRIKLPTEIFSHLFHHPKGPPKDQITSLIHNAIAEGLTPAYCFYTVSRWNLPTYNWPSVIVPKPQPINGCLIGHAQIIQDLGRNELTALAPYLFPWHFLVCPRTGAAPDLCDSAAAAMADGISGSITVAPRILDANVSPFLAEKRESVPPYVQQLLATPDIGDVAAYDVLEQANAQSRGIRGIVAFTIQRGYLDE
jgi:hypothetical protein